MEEDECHPAMLAAMRASPENLPHLVQMGAASPYPVGRDDVHLPPHKIRGRSDAAQGHFTGWIDATTGRLRVDHTSNVAFWLEVDLSELMDAYMAWKYRPGGSDAAAAIGNARSIANADMSQSQSPVQQPSASSQ